MKKIFFIVIVCAVLLGSAAAALVIFAANDAFAFEKSGGITTVTIENDIGSSALADKLYEAKVIDSVPVFRIYCALRKKTSFGPGVFTVSRSMSYDEIFSSLSGKKERTQIKITIPEGAYTDDIISIFVSNGIGTREGFEEALDGDYGYSFIPEKTAGRTYRCDGYLYPDTYFFYSDSTEKEVVSKLIGSFDRKFGEDLREIAKGRGLTVDECVTLASIIQREAYYTAEMAALSSVLHNRLASKTLRRLECDSTVTFAWKKTGGDGDFLSIDSPYNSYKYEGLPPGPICSPGASALEAAANPKNTPYYYFFSKSDNTFVFSRTFSEHIAGLRKYGVGSERTK